jgi:hypothetical protein
LKLKPLLAATAVSVGAMAFASPALALPGDPAVDSSAPFRLNQDTLEPGCWNGSRLGDVHFDVGSTEKEAHISVRNGASYSVDQVLIPSRTDGYKIYNTFDTGTINNDPDVDPNQTATDLGTSDGGRIASWDIIVCVSDHPDADQNEPYLQEAGGLVSAKNRPIIAPLVSCLGASAIQPLNTYKVGFGYAVERGYDPAGTTDPNARDTNGDGIADAVRINPREDGGVFDARRVNDFDSFGEDFSGDKDDYGQTRLFSLAGDPTAWTLSNNDDPDTFWNLITFTAQGDLPLTWSVRASLAGSATLRSVTLDDDALRAWAASWQAYYEGGAKPTMALCPGTNSPAPATTVVVNLPQQAVPVPGTNTVITKETTTIQTVAGPTVVKRVAAKNASKKARKAACMRKAKAKKGAARRKAVRRCNRR